MLHASARTRGEKQPPPRAADAADGTEETPADRHHRARVERTFVSRSELSEGLVAFGVSLTNRARAQRAERRPRGGGYARRGVVTRPSPDARPPTRPP